MKASISWLKDYVPIDVSVSELADKLTMSGFEVESVSNRYEYLDSVVVGRILNLRPHPNANKLRLCDVDIGNRVVPVVCGAPNAQKDMLYPLALPGTLLPNGMFLEKTVIRGETSEGMLCSEAELGIGDDKRGIMLLKSDLKVGDKIEKALGLSDTVLEISITPNRPDCLSVIGIAREIAALYKREIKYPDINISESGNQISKYTSITIEAPDHCPRYAAKLLENIRVGQSPFWLRDRLMSIGQRPINNIVDITNFVMMEMGQPLHAFDFDQLAENRIVVRTANEKEKFTTLDKKERELTSDMLMICDGKKPVAVAGVMGGLNSEIENTTKRVLLESAYFNPTSIRKTSKKLGLSTEASYRFERGIDPDMSVRAANRAALLMAELSGGKIIAGVIDAHPKKIESKRISLNVNKANQILSTDLNQNTMAELLKSVEFNVEQADNNTLSVLAPPFRVDVSRPEDLMEEIARLWGYDNIPTTFPMLTADAKLPSKQRILRDQIRGILIGFGFTEAVNYSFIHKLSCDRICIGKDDERRNLVEVMNPLSEDQAVMRTSLIPGMLETMRRNILQQNRSLRLFEIGKTFIGNGKDELPDEPEMLAVLLTGSRFDTSWHSDRKDTDCDFYDLKGIAEGLLKSLNISHAEFTRIPDELCVYTRPGYSARIFVPIGNEADGIKAEVGLIGEVRPEVLRNFDLRQTAFIFVMNLTEFVPLVPDIKKGKAIPKYPAVARDVTLIIPKDVEAGSILESVKYSGEELVEDLYFFDVYEGEAIPKGNKSISFRITYRSSNETLEDEAVNDIHKKIADMLLKKFDAALPSV